ncbi:MAG: HEAT repeat domain-containing protein [Solirubrobacterales bacterium]|nr:HEAT repeat domain-containing protein [Solirubrobacterales bacterium]
MRRADATERWRSVLASRSASELTAALDDPSPEVARAAIRRLTDIEGRRAASPLRARLLSADLSLTVDIATALRELGDEQAVAMAVAGSSSQPYLRRLAPARALGSLRAAGALRALRSALRDEIAGVRAAAVSALAEIGPDGSAGATEDCASLLIDPDAHVRIAAVRTVARIAPRPGASGPHRRANPLSHHGEVLLGGGLSTAEIDVVQPVNRNKVDVGVRNLQANYDHPHASRLGDLPNRARNRSRERQQSLKERLGQIEYVRNLGLRNHERVALANRTNIQEGEEIGVLAQDLGRSLTRDDATEYGRHR